MRAVTTKRVLLSALLLSHLYGDGEFSATIVNNSECMPKSTNDRPSKGMQENRRVDVAIDTKIYESKKVAYKSSIKSRIYLNDSGVIWATSDLFVNEPHLIIKSLGYYPHKDKKIRFYTYSNYGKFIDRYEIYIFKEGDKEHKDPIKVLSGDRLESEIVWDLEEDKINLDMSENLLYSLRVYDKSGRFDETRYAKLTINKTSKSAAFRDIEGEIFGKSELKIHTIPISGARVRVFGSDLPQDSLLKIADREVRVDSSGKFVYEELREAGRYNIPISILTSKGDMYEDSISLNVKDSDLFMVGLADFTAGKYNISGNIKPLESDEHFNEDIFIDGRLAFYLKGKIKGKYLLTAQMDTQESDIKDMFKNIHKKDPSRAFRNLDPDQYYYLYGDDSTSYLDTDTQGKLYLRVDWDNSKALWGNFNSGITGNEFANINRSLYGAKLQHSSMDVTKFGDNKRDVTIFASEAQSSYAHNEFEATGGSLYYLKHRDIIEGSEKVWIEIQERNSLQIADKIELKRGEDYEIDEIQGRVILTRPITPRSKISGPSIIKDMPLDGDRVVLKVDYEYLPDDFKPNQATYGARAKEWLTDYLAVGATYGHEGRDADDYEIKGADLTLRTGKDSYIKAEFASSDSLQSNGASFRSFDGGLSFNNIDTNKSNLSGNAYGIEAKVSFADFKALKSDATARFWYKNREDGFSNARVGDSSKAKDYGLESVLNLSKDAIIKLRANRLQKSDLTTDSASLEGDYKFGDLRVGAELRDIKESRTAATNRGSLAGVKIGYNISQDLLIYSAIQTTLRKEGGYESNDLYSVGGELNLEKLRLNVEASSGDRGDSIELGADYRYKDASSLYVNYTLSTDFTQGDTNLLTLGERTKLSDSLSIFSEHQFSHSDKMAGVGNSFGIDYAFTRYLFANVTYTKSSYDNSSIEDRDSISTSLNYNNKDVTASTKLEFREDQGKHLHQKQYLTTNRVSYKLNPSWRVMAKYNYSKSIDTVEDKKDATFTEAGVGFVYRPIDNSRFNMIGKYTYLYDLSSLDQIKNSSDEKSHIISLEGSYQLSSKWSIGSKIGMKNYSIRADRDSGEWHDSKLYLGALRLNYHLISKWDALLESHILKLEDDGVKSGFLTGVYRHIGNHLKFGVGYNFTDFSDDLRDINDYEVRGWFINLIGKF